MVNVDELSYIIYISDLLWCLSIETKGSSELRESQTC